MVEQIVSSRIKKKADAERREHLPQNTPMKTKNAAPRALGESGKGANDFCGGGGRGISWVGLGRWIDGEESIGSTTGKHSTGPVGPRPLQIYKCRARDPVPGM